jgi:hypothetical protein
MAVHGGGHLEQVRSSVTTTFLLTTRSTETTGRRAPLSIGIWRRQGRAFGMERGRSTDSYRFMTMKRVRGWVIPCGRVVHEWWCRRAARSSAALSKQARPSHRNHHPQMMCSGAQFVTGAGRANTSAPWLPPAQFWRTGRAPFGRGYRPCVLTPEMAASERLRRSGDFVRASVGK